MDRNFRRAVESYDSAVVFHNLAIDAMLPNGHKDLEHALFWPLKRRFLLDQVYTFPVQWFSVVKPMKTEAKANAAATKLLESICSALKEALPAQRLSENVNLGVPSTLALEDLRRLNASIQTGATQEILVHDFVCTALSAAARELLRTRKLRMGLKHDRAPSHVAVNPRYITRLGMLLDPLAPEFGLINAALSGRVGGSLATLTRFSLSVVAGDRDAREQEKRVLEITRKLRDPRNFTQNDEKNAKLFEFFIVQDDDNKLVFDNLAAHPLLEERGKPWIGGHVFQSSLGLFTQGALTLAPMATLQATREATKRAERTRVRSECHRRYGDFWFGDSSQSECLKLLVSRRFDNDHHKQKLDDIQTEPKLRLLRMATIDVPPNQFGAIGTLNEGRLDQEERQVPGWFHVAVKDKFVVTSHSLRTGAEATAFFECSHQVALLYTKWKARTLANDAVERVFKDAGVPVPSTLLAACLRDRAVEPGGRRRRRATEDSSDGTPLHGVAPVAWHLFR
ncbi:MAG: hypothetical protein MHM6MM_000200 [Cercozoa sp. M6MM]